MKYNRKMDVRNEEAAHNHNEENLYEPILRLDDFPVESDPLTMVILAQL